MKRLLALAHAIDDLNDGVGRFTRWLVLAAVLISAGNAVARYGLDLSSNAWLEIQWYLFALIFLLGAAYTLRHNGHVRIDVLYGRWSVRTRAWIDLLGTLLFLLPVCALIAWLSWRGFEAAYASGERSPDAGGLLRWPIRLAIPVGFALLLLQGVAEAIKQAAILAGHLSATQEAAEETV